VVTSSASKPLREPYIGVYVNDHYHAVRRHLEGCLSRASTVQPYVDRKIVRLCLKACFELPGRQAVCKTSN